MSMSDQSGKEEGKTLRYVEFYCGVGGWTMALDEAVKRIDEDRSLQLKRLAALDHSDMCLDVLHQNFSATHGTNTPAAVTEAPGSNNNKKRKRPQKAVAIERISLKQAQEWNADIWLMSPPCQPHTRQHDNQDDDLVDQRSKSFLHLCDLLETMEEVPPMLLLENVIGFEKSGSCKRWRQVLSQRGYEVAHFHLTPTQVGLPNDRPRYFCVAVMADSSDTDNASETTNSDQSKLSYGELRKTFTKESTENLIKPAIIQTQVPALQISPPDSVGELPPISNFLDKASQDETLRIPEKLLSSQAAWCFDIVTPKNTRTACFTHSYGKFVKGTGSVLYEGPVANYEKLALEQPENREFDADWASGLKLNENLRYFSGCEMARLFGFSSSFQFPPSCSPKQQRKLLGNSLNVHVAGRLCELALRVMCKVKSR